MEVLNIAFFQLGHFSSMYYAGNLIHYASRIEYHEACNLHSSFWRHSSSFVELQ
jgi:hypothetical protein